MDIGKSKDDWKEVDLPAVETDIYKVIDTQISLDPDKINDRENRFSKKIFDPSKVYNKNVVVVGVGALGSLLSFYLVKLGTDLILVDHDKISPSNLNRSLFLPKDLCRSKVLALTEFLEPFRTTRDQRIAGYALPFDEFLNRFEKVAESADLVIATVDNNKAVYQIVRYCKNRELPHIISGVSEDSKFLKVFWDAPWAEGGCFRCYHPSDSMDKGSGSGCDDVIHPSICFPHAIAAGLVTYLTKVVLMEDCLDYRELLMNIGSGGTYKRKKDVTRKKNCEICGGGE